MMRITRTRAAINVSRNVVNVMRARCRIEVAPASAEGSCVFMNSFLKTKDFVPAIQHWCDWRAQVIESDYRQRRWERHCEVDQAKWPVAKRSHFLGCEF